MLMVFPSLIHFNDPPRDGSTDMLAKTAAEKRKLFLPKCHIFYGSRVVDILDGKPKYKGYQGGERMSESE